MVLYYTGGGKFLDISERAYLNRRALGVVHGFHPALIVSGSVRIIILHVFYYEL